MVNMCEIFCFSAKTPKQINSLLEGFYSHSENHPHGWGLANMCGNDSFIKKEPLKASDSELLASILSRPIVGKTIFAHIRLATVGEVTPINCHPFIQKDDGNRRWMLMHNGTLFEFPQGEKYRKIQKGNTDSERILLYIIDKINEFENDNALSSAEERFNLINELLSQLADGNKLNIMIYDGELTYVHSNMKDCLYTLKNDDELVIASSPVNDDENWKEIEINKVYGIVDGNVVFKGKNHGKEFIFTKEHEKAIMEMIPPELKQQYLNSQKLTAIH